MSIKVLDNETPGIFVLLQRLDKNFPTSITSLAETQLPAFLMLGCVLQGKAVWELLARRLSPRSSDEILPPTLLTVKLCVAGQSSTGAAGT